MRQILEKIFPVARDLRYLPKSVWLYTLVMLMNVSRKTVFLVMGEVGDYGSVNQSSSLMVLFMVITLFILCKESKQAKVCNSKIKPIMAYHILGILSFIWAGNFMPIIMKAGEVILAILLTTVIISKISNRRVCLTYILFLCFIPVVLDLIGRRFSYFHTNLYTFSASMGLMICLGGVKYNIYRLKEVRNLIFLFILFVLIGTSSASYIATLVGIIVFFSCGKKGISIGQTVVSVGLALIAWNVGEEVIKHYVFYGKDELTIESGTGRKAIWEAYMQMIYLKPLLGWGFLVGERMLGTVFGFTLNVISAHNSFMSSIVGMGIVGLSFFVYFVLNWMMTLYKKCRCRDVFALTLLPAFAVFLVNTNSFPAIGTDWNYVGTALYAMYAFAKLKM